MSDTHAALSLLAEALDEFERDVADNAERTREIRRRLVLYRASIERGGDLRDLIAGESRPSTVELISANMATLERSGARFRAAQALVLRDEGLTLEEIAQLFGVKRQRISAMLKQRSADKARGD